MTQQTKVTHIVCFESFSHFNRISVYSHSGSFQRFNLLVLSINVFSPCSQLICSYVFMPVAFMMGIPYDESFTVAELIGTKLFLNEFVAYEKLSELKSNRLNGLDEVIGGERQWISVSRCPSSELGVLSA